jgi:hypothetical protein
MSDVGVAPAPAPAAAQSEVPINENPVNAPAPVTNQPPEAPIDMKDADPRRESIRKAFERAKVRDPNDRGEPRKAKMGDNNPPEDTKPEREKPEKIDLKRSPSDQPRDRGRFAARAPEGTPQGDPGSPQVRGRLAEGTPQASGQPQQYRQLPENEPYREPLARMTPHAKADWAATPVNVRSDVHRMHKEFGEAFLRYQSDHKTMNTIRQYEQMAKEHGTTLQRALDNYTTMEKKLRADPFGGFDVITHNLNLRSPDGQKLTFRDLAWAYLNQTPEQHKLTQSENAQTAQSHQIGQLHSMVNTLAQGIQEMQYERKFTHTRSAIDRYADTHPRIDELGDLITQEIKLGFDLDTAYRRAELLRPATAAQTRTSTTAQTRTADPDRSIHGAPATAPNGAQRRSNGKPVGRREAIANAIKRVNGSL